MKNFKKNAVITYQKLINKYSLNIWSTYSNLREMDNINIKIYKLFLVIIMTK